MSETVIVSPLRGHQSQHLRRWVDATEDAYPCPSDEARRLVRHGCVEIVGGVDEAGGEDETATVADIPDEEEEFSFDNDEEYEAADDEEVVS